MKNLKIYISLFTICLSFWAGVNAQVSITYTNTGNICQGNTVQFNDPAVATSFNFNTATNSFPAGWSATGFEIGKPCTVNSNDNSDYFWAGAGTGARYVETNDVNVSSGGTISFDLRYGNDDPQPGCEQVDSGEHVTLEYSINGGSSWIAIQAYITIFYTWQIKSEPIPAGAQTTSTRFRWIQYNNSSTGYDNWGLDDIIIGVDAPTVDSYLWDFGDGGTSIAQAPAHTFSGSGNHNVTVLVTYTDNSTGNDSEIIYINPKPTVTLNNTQTPVCREATPFALTGGSPSGGTYGGSAVSSNTFYPGSAGIGNNSISYSYVSPAGCAGDPASDIIYVNPTPTVTFGSITPTPVHLYVGATLSGGTPSGAGGTYSGTGVSGTNYLPTSTGSKTLYYTYVDGNTCTATANKSVTVTDDAPVMTVNQSPVPEFYMLTPAVVLFPDLTIVDSDGGYIDGAVLDMTVTHNSTSDRDQLIFVNTGSITGSYNYTNGTLTLTGHASLADYQAALRSVTYQNTGTAFPDETRAITLAITSATSGTDTGNGSVHVVPNRLPEAFDDIYDVYEDNYVLVVPVTGVLGNDSDPDGDAITAVIQNNPTHAQSFSLNSNGSFSYEPIDGFVGNDSFTYFANDNKVNSLLPATVTIQVLHPTWDGTGDWHDPTNWNGSMDPSQALDSVLLNNGTATIGTANAEVRVLTMTANGTFMAQNGYYLQIDDALRNNTRRVISLNSPMRISSSVEVPMDLPPVKDEKSLLCVSGSSLLHINGTYLLNTDGLFHKDASRIGIRDGVWQLWDLRINDGKCLFSNPSKSNVVPSDNWIQNTNQKFSEPSIYPGGCK